MLPILGFAAAVLLAFAILRNSRNGLGHVRRLVLPIVAVSVVGVFLTGGIPVGSNGDEDSRSLPVVVLVGVALLALGLLLGSRPREVTEQRWTSSPPAATSARLATQPDSAFTADSSSVATGERAPDHRPSSSWAVARSLGRVESRELAVSPLFAVGIGFCVLTVLLFVVIWGDDDSTSWQEFIQYLPWFAHPLVGMTVLASHRAVTRAGRDDATELFDTCPAEQSTRTVGFLLTSVVPMAAITIYLAVMIIGTVWRSPFVHGPVGIASVGDVLGTIALGAGGVALGVALGRWVGFALAPVVAVVAIGMVSTGLNGVGGSDWNPLRQLSTVPTIEGHSPVFTYRPVAWHILWLVALTGLVVAASFARHRRDRVVVALAVVSLVVGVIAGIGATRPMPASSARGIAALVAEPEAHQECLAVSDRVSMCTYALHREFLGRSAGRLAPIAAALPEAATPVTLRQVYIDELADLPPEVRRLLTEDDLVRPAGEVVLLFELAVAPLDHGLDLALGAVGLPARAGPDHLPYVAAGEARGVIALWLAARGLDPQDAARLTKPAAVAPADDFERGSVYPTESCDVPPVVWSAQDLTAARAVLDLPTAEVTRVIDEDWARWIDPSTTTDELLAALGLPGLGPPDRFVPRPGQPC